MRGWITATFVTIGAAAVAWPVHGGVMVCGGVGSDEREALAESTRGANLALEFFVAPRGAYLADVDVTLTPLRDSGPTVEAHADGPVCYVKVPPGHYRIEATFEGETRTAQAAIPASAASPVKIALAFPDTGTLGSEPAPTPEEKRHSRPT